MSNSSESTGGSYLWQGGRRINIAKVPGQFTVRVKPGANTAALARAEGLEQRRVLERQNLALLATPAPDLDTAMERVRASDDVAFASHVYQFAGDPESRVYLTDEITVQFRPGVSDSEIESLAAQHGLEFVKPVSGIPHTYVLRLTAQATENPIKITNRLAASDKVLASEPNIVVPAQSFFTPSDPLFNEQWHLDHQGGPFLTNGSHLDATQAWEITRGDRSIVVAIADDSVDLHHVDLRGAGKIVAPIDFAGRDFAPLPEALNDNHGTACAGVAVAENNGQGVVGVAPECALMPIRTTGLLDDNAIEELFDWCIDHGASVISCSWGPVARDFPLSLRKENALRRAATLGRGGRGCVILFAAGNANRPVDGIVDEQGWPPGYPAGPTRWHNGFTAHEHVLAVAASTSMARKAAYSNWGDQISICAPSNNGHPQIYDPNTRRVIPTYPLITRPLPGRGIVTTDRVGLPGYNSADYTRTFGGTSSACPAAAGVAALVLAANPALTAREVRTILEHTADKIIDTTTDPQLGTAFGTYDERGHSRWFGYGKVNAFRAVTRAVQWAQPGDESTQLPDAQAGAPLPDEIRDILDDFKRIKGIGPAVERRLRAAGIITFAQLAALRPEELALLVADIAGLSTERIKKYKWPERARELVGEPRERQNAAAGSVVTEPLTTPRAPERNRYATFKVEFLLDEQNNVRRTQVVHVQDGAEETWPGWQPHRLIDFFAAGADLTQRPVTQPAAATAAPGQVVPGSATRLQLDLGDVSVVEDDPGHHLEEHGLARPLRVAFNFEIAAAGAEEEQLEETTYLVQVLAYSLEDDRTVVLGSDTGRLPSEHNQHTITAYVPMPEVGRYQLLGTVIVPQRNIFLEAPGPVLQVVP